MIEISHLTKRYGTHTAVDDLNLTIEKGRIYGFLGPNGAGKSTTMNMITGYLAASGGTVTIDGHDILKEPNKAKAHIGYLPEIPPLYPDMTVLEYMSFVAELKGIPKADRENEVDEACVITGISDVAGRLIRNLSKGYRQRVGIAQAIIGKPDIIILDEPTAGLDPAQIIEVRDLIRELGKEHTVILSSHILSEISEVCGYVFIISKGKLVAADETDKLLSGDGVSAAQEIEITVARDSVDEKASDETSIADGSDIEKIFLNLQGVRLIEPLGALETGTLSYKIIAEEKRDIRADVFKAAAGNGLVLLNLSGRQKSLEDVFLELTRESEETETADADDLTDAADSDVNAADGARGEGGEEQ